MEKISIQCTTDAKHIFIDYPRSVAWSVLYPSVSPATIDRVEHLELWGKRTVIPLLDT